MMSWAIAMCGLRVNNQWRRPAAVKNETGREGGYDCREDMRLIESVKEGATHPCSLVFFPYLDVLSRKR